MAQTIPRDKAIEDSPRYFSFFSALFDYPTYWDSAKECEGLAWSDALID